MGRDPKDTMSNGSKKRAKTKQFSTGNRVEWKGYINVPLVEADKRHFHQWRAQPSIVEETLQAALRDGYKLSVDWQQRENAFRASLYCQNAEFNEAGYCLSIFASEWWKAVCQLLYIHVVKCNADWTPFIRHTRQADDWDDYE